MPGLQVVWDMQFAPDGRMFLTERPGMIRTVTPDGELVEEPWLNVEEQAFYIGESGVMGIALDPDFEEDPWVYVMYSVLGVEGGPFDRVSRFREEGGKAGQEQVLLDSLPSPEATANNRGGSLAFGPDGMLYISVGDHFRKELAADPDDPHGSILRITPDGRIPADNPSPDSPVWAYGFRNVHGMAWHPETGDLWVADHGPSGGDEGSYYDRILIVERGADHGWPGIVTEPGSEQEIEPVIVFDQASPPGDIAFANGDLYMTILGFDPVGGHALLRVQLDDSGGKFRPVAQERWFNDVEGNTVHGRLRGLAVGPDGSLYIGTSNTDGRRSGGGSSVGRNRGDTVLRVSFP